jgi:hypothetical protein
MRTPLIDLRATRPLGEPYVPPKSKSSHQFNIDQTAGMVVWTIWIAFLVFFAIFVLWAAGPLVGILIILVALGKLRF